MAMADRVETAGVLFPPPLLYAGGFLLGIVLDWALALPRVPRPPWVLGLGGLLLGIQAVVGFSAFRQLRRARTNVNPYKPSTAVVTAGIYRRSRNPIYLSMTMLYLGLALVLGVLGPLLLLLPVLLVMHFGVIVREERYLDRKFGLAYRDYRASVRRWL
jgi:protein-S-isoprenylcysteine O-methyltransferase Ste14